MANVARCRFKCMCLLFFVRFFFFLQCLCLCYWCYECLKCSFSLVLLEKTLLQNESYSNTETLTNLWAHRQFKELSHNQAKGAKMLHKDTGAWTIAVSVAPCSATLWHFRSLRFRVAPSAPRARSSAAAAAEGLGSWPPPLVLHNMWQGSSETSSSLSSRRVETRGMTPSDSDWSHSDSRQEICCVPDIQKLYYSSNC